MSTQTALITGASRGLGLALARELAQQNWRLIINARGADALEHARKELAKWTEVIAIAGDVTDPQHRKALAHAAKENRWPGRRNQQRGHIGTESPARTARLPTRYIGRRLSRQRHRTSGGAPGATTHLKIRCPCNQHHQRCRSRSVPWLGWIRLIESRA